MSGRRVLGLVINPVAGLGGAAALKGSDGAETQALARARGSRPRSGERAQRALAGLPAGTEILTAAGTMGAEAARAAGCVPLVRYRPGTPDPDAPAAGSTAAPDASRAASAPDPDAPAAGSTAASDAPAAASTSPEDTIATVRALAAAGAGLILFAGGDGTARDVLRGLVDAPGPVAVLGIPTGVKMYSSVFAVSPAAAGAVAAAWLRGADLTWEEREVLDVSEAQLGAGIVDATLFGTALTPVLRGRTQARKAATGAADADAVRGVAGGLVTRMHPDVTYLLGPGGTMRAVADALGVAKTPLGVDAVRDGRLVAADATAAQLIDLAKAGPSQAVVTVIGGQGFLLGRGNQQFSPDLLRALIDPPLLVGATAAKLAALPGPLLVDTGDDALDAALAGHVRVVTGPQDIGLVPVRPASAAPGGPPSAEEPRRGELP